MKPQRIQLKRIKGWKMPANTINIARPGRWGNQYRVGINGTAEEVVEKYRKFVEGSCWSFLIKKDIQKELRGKNLACWCKIYDKKGLRIPCHGDILLKIANK